MVGASGRGRWRGGWVWVAVWSVVLAGAVSAPSAHAAPGSVASGEVRVDANANGAVDAGPAGESDRGIAGVQVKLVAADGVTVLASTVTGANGSWSIAKSDVIYPVTVQIDTSGMNGNVYETSTKLSAGVNDMLRSDAPNRASAVVSAADTVLNALVYPVWELDAKLAADPNGLGGKSVLTGTPVFDADDSEPGLDSGPENARVRTSDIVTFNWSLTAQSEDGSLGATFRDAVFEQTVTLAGGTVANFASIPAICNSAKSRISAYPSGASIGARVDPPSGTTSVVLTCVVGVMGNAPASSAYLLGTQVQPSAKSANGSRMETSARFYAVDGAGVAMARPAAGPGVPSIEVTGAPRYDVEKLMGAFGNYLGFQNGEAGLYAYYTIQIAADREVGVEAFKQPLTLQESFWGLNPGTGTQLADLRWYVTQCIPSPAPADNQAPQGLVFGRIGGSGSLATAENSARNSGTCSIGTRTAPDTGSYDLTLSGIDASGLSYPTKTASGASLSAGKYYVASYRVQIFIPLSEFDRSDGTIDGNGSLSYFNRVGNFDPDGLSGASNYGDKVEPGNCVEGTPLDRSTQCAPMRDGSRSNNVVGPHNVRSTPGTWVNYLYDWVTGWGGGPVVLPDAARAHDGAGQVQPGQTFTSMQVLNSTGSLGLSGAQVCDVFDNTLLKLSHLNRDVSSSNQFSDGLYSAALSGTGSVTDPPAVSQADQVNWVFEYGTVDISRDNPNLGEFDVANNRWKGDWSQQKALVGAGSCGDSEITWHSSPESVPGGVDAVNVARVRAVDGHVLPPGRSVRWLLAFEQRDTYNGGPHDGEAIPTGTIAANFGSVRSDQWQSGWLRNGYVPGSGTTGGGTWTGENGSGDGDRWTIARAQMRLQKRTVAATVGGQSSTGVADYGVTGAAIAGRPVVWQITSALSAMAAEPAPVSNVVVTDTLPNYVVYDEAGTVELGGLVPNVTANADGTTTLTWLLGERLPNDDLPVLQVSTYVSPLTPPNTTAVNTATITGDGVVLAAAHTDTHTIRIEQTGQVQLDKSVDRAVDFQNKDQVFTLAVKNFSDTLAIAAPTVYEVLSFNGDGTNAVGVNRTPASDFAGSNVLDRAPRVEDWSGMPRAGTFYYTTVPGDQVPQSRKHDTNPSIWSTTFTPAATGFKFVASGPLATNNNAGSGLRIVFRTNQVGNEPGDVYTNRFTAVSDTLDSGRQLLTSNTVSVRVAGFSLGDFLWFDVDRNGEYDSGVDRPVPAGVTVEVRDAGGAVVASTQTLDADKQGRWAVHNLPAGDYYVTIPGSQFASGGLLAGAAAGPGAVLDPNTDLNETSDHHGVQASFGVRSSGLITLSALETPEEVTSEEPLGDNVASLLLPPLTTDGFTNFTLDMALVPAVDFTVTKAVTGDGASWTNGPYVIEVSCVLDGVSVPGFPREVTISQALVGVPQVLTAPLGSACTAAETDAAGASSVSIDPVGGILLDAENEALNIQVNNVFDTGILRISKEVVGVGANLADPELIFGVSCTFRGQTTLNATFALPDDQGATGPKGQRYSREFEGGPVGSTCVIQEIENGGADRTPAPVQITIDNNPATVQTAGFVNEYSAGQVTVRKILDGTGATNPVVTDLTYQVRVICALGDTGPDQILFFDSTLWLTPGTPTPLDVDGQPIQLPTGARCWMPVETISQGASQVTLSHDSYDKAVSVEPGNPNQVQNLNLEAVNTFNQANFTVTKVVQGPGLGLDYEFELSCTYPVTNKDGSNQNIPYPLSAEDAAFTLANGQSRTISLLVGATCELSEADPLPGVVISFTRIGPSRNGITINPAAMQIPAEGLEIQVTNTYPNPPVSQPTPPIIDPATAIPLTGSTNIFSTVLATLTLLLGGIAFLFTRRVRKGLL